MNSKIETPYLDKEIKEIEEWISETKAINFLDKSVLNDQKSNLQEYQSIKEALKRLAELEADLESVKMNRRTYDETAEALERCQNELERVKEEINNLQKKYDENGFDFPLDVKLKRIENALRSGLKQSQAENERLRQFKESVREIATTYGDGSVSERMMQIKELLKQKE